MIVMKFGTGVPYKMLSRKLEFCENRLKVSHTSNASTRAILKLFYKFLNHLGNSVLKMSTKFTWLSWGFVKIGAVKTML